ncbi:addiction module toxin [Gammaproteobacteria bacterium SCGC AG-212-F23]|nr:addiction module toxin [Gammaproteobacteria bacterium SCGC AG-212-F23]
MWTVYEKKSLLKTLQKIPVEILKHYELWKRIVEFEGIQGLRLVKGFHDEALKGKLDGYRSSRLSKQWRVIYKVEKKLLEVYVIDVNPHDYKLR